MKFPAKMVAKLEALAEADQDTVLNYVNSGMKINDAYQRTVAGKPELLSALRYQDAALRHAAALGLGRVSFVSEFVVRLPVLQPPEQQMQPPSTETANQPTHALRVLVVDDNVDQADSNAVEDAWVFSERVLIGDDPNVNWTLERMPDTIQLKQ